MSKWIVVCADYVKTFPTRRQAADWVNTVKELGFCTLEHYVMEVEPKE